MSTLVFVVTCTCTPLLFLYSETYVPVELGETHCHTNLFHHNKWIRLEKLHQRIAFCINYSFSVFATSGTVMLHVCTSLKSNLQKLNLKSQGYDQDDLALASVGQI